MSKLAHKMTAEEFCNVQLRGKKAIESRTYAVQPKAWELSLRRRRFWELAQTPEWHMLTLVEKGKVLEVSHTTIQKWENLISDEEWRKALAVARERHAKTSLKIDAAVIREGLRGNIKASELFYRRIENWTPKTGMELSKGGDGDINAKGDRELLVGLLASLTPEERKSLLEDAEKTKMEAPPEPGSGFLQLQQPETEKQEGGPEQIGPE